MKFGQVPLESLDQINFSLPQSDRNNERILKPTQGKKLNIRFGCTAWGNKQWVGKLYPQKTPQNKFLNAYSQQFKTVELNPTHYRIPSYDQVEKWASVVPTRFEFCPKVYQAISHWDRLNDTRGTTERFCDAISHFQDHLGPSFLQMHPTFKANNMDVLSKYLEKWPSEFPLALELRDESWFKPETKDTLFSLLESQNVMPVITDTAGHRELLHMRLSSSKIMIRFVGNKLHSSDFNRINEWITRIEEWHKLGLTDCWFFMHQHEELHSPALIKYMADIMDEKGFDVQAPVILEEQGSLF